MDYEVGKRLESIRDSLHRLEKWMSKLDDKITSLQSQVQTQTTVIDGAVALINGIKAEIDVAIQDALSKGATDQELQAMTDLGSSLDTSTQKLAAAVQANTPAQGPKPSP